MEYSERHSDEELSRIVDQALIHMCDCTTQVVQALQKTRELFRYQKECVSNKWQDSTIHEEIARSAAKAHETLQLCLDRIIAMENWDRRTLEMPHAMRLNQLQILLAAD